jgi:hypothetical protein
MHHANRTALSAATDVSWPDGRSNRQRQLPGMPGWVTMLIAGVAWRDVWFRLHATGRRAQRFLRMVEHCA